MKELGTINRSISKAISEQGHQDLLMVVDAGFPIPKEVEVIDISLGETIDHSELKRLSKIVKAVIRTGDFTAYGNVILVSGAGNRWYCEK
jgi:simple sugar transport system permease protein/D-ribose pyranase